MRVMNCYYQWERYLLPMLILRELVYTRDNKFEYKCKNHVCLRQESHRVLYIHVPFVAYVSVCGYVCGHKSKSWRVIQERSVSYWAIQSSMTPGRTQHSIVSHGRDTGCSGGLRLCETTPSNPSIFSPGTVSVQSHSRQESQENYTIQNSYFGGE